MAGNCELATKLWISKSMWEIRRVPQPWLLTEVKVSAVVAPNCWNMAGFWELLGPKKSIVQLVSRGSKCFLMFMSHEFLINLTDYNLK